MKAFLYIVICLIAFQYQVKCQVIKTLKYNSVSFAANSINLEEGYLVLEKAGGKTIRYSDDGTIIFSKLFVQDTSIIIPINAAESPNGDLGYVCVDSNLNVIINKTDSIGNLLWSNFVDLGFDGGYTESKIEFDSEGNLYVMPSQYSQVSLMKFDQLGNLIWTTSFNAGSGTKNPGFMFTFTKDWEIIGTAKSDDYLQVFKIDTLGNLVWSKVMVNYPYYYYTHPNLLIALSEDSFLIGGHFSGYLPSGYIRGLITLKIDLDGQIIQSKIIFNTNNSNDYLYFGTSGLLSNSQIGYSFSSLDGLFIGRIDQNLNISNIQGFMNYDNYGDFTYKLSKDILNSICIDNINTDKNLLRINMLQTNTSCSIFDATQFSSLNYIFDSTYFDNTFTIHPDLVSLPVTNVQLNPIYIDDQLVCGTSELDILNTPEFNAVNGSVFYYPNPTSNTISIVLNNLTNYKISIFEIQGKQIYQSNENINSIDVSKFPSGMYLLQISDGNQIFTEKFIKE